MSKKQANPAPSFNKPPSPTGPPPRKSLLSIIENKKIFNVKNAFQFKAKQIPSLTSAQMIRVNKDNNTLLVWFGGRLIYMYSLQTGQEAQEAILVTDPIKDYISYSVVKKTMKAIIGGSIKQ